MIQQNIKEKIFSLYYGQQILRIVSNSSNLFYNTPVLGRWSDKTSFLMLKPLSQITDEHAIEVAKMMGYDRWTTIKRYEKHIEVRFTRKKDERKEYWQDGILFIDTFLIDIFFDEVDVESYFIPAKIRVYDFLRSKGYALPAYSYSVEELVEQGIFKLKTNH